MSELIQVIQAIEAVKAIQTGEATPLDPMGSNTVWVYDALVHSQYTCDECAAYDGTRFRGDEIDAQFPYHIPVSSVRIFAMVHPNCRCELLLVEVVST